MRLSLIRHYFSLGQYDAYCYGEPAYSVDMDEQRRAVYDRGYQAAMANRLYGVLRKRQLDSVKGSR